VLGGLLTALLSTPPELDQADSTRYQLIWEAPDRCPSTEQVRERIDELIAVTPADPHDERIRVEVRVSEQPPSFVASVRMQSAASDGRRELGDVDCDELAESVALIIALAVDPELMSRESESIDEPIAAEPVDEPVPTIEPSEAIEPVEPSDPARPSAGLRGFGLALRGGAGLAVLSTASARASLSASSFGRLWRAEIGVAMSMPQTIDMGRFSSAAAELRGCWVPELGPIELPVCAGFEVGAMTGVGRTGDGRRATAPWLAAAPGLGMSWVGLQNRLALGLRVDALLPLLRPAFASDEGRLLVRAGAGAQALVGVEVRFSTRRDRAR
jgi:hypothetical protein